MNPASDQIEVYEDNIANAEQLIEQAESARDTAWNNLQDQIAVVENRENTVSTQQGYMQDHLSWVNSHRGGNMSLSSSPPYWQGFPGVPTSSDTYMTSISNTSSSLGSAISALNQAVSTRNELQGIYDSAESEYQSVYNTQTGKIENWQDSIDGLNDAYQQLIAEGIDPDVAGQIAMENHQSELSQKEFQRLVIKWGLIIGGGIATVFALVLLWKYLKKQKIIKG